MNSLIETIFKKFSVNGVLIPVSFSRYTGSLNTYITYNEMKVDDTFYSEDNLDTYLDYYDFDIYSKGNYLEIIESVKNLLKTNGFTWQPSMTSADLYEDDTGYYHKTLCFSIERSENNG